MGCLRDQPLNALMHELRDEYQITTFIETGTSNGDSALAAAAIFDSVITIENDPIAIANIIDELSGWPHNIEFIAHDSRHVLNGLPLPDRTLFWLDAHTATTCPLIEELDAIGGGHVILIDDARQVHWYYHWQHEPRIAWPQFPVLETWTARHGYSKEMLEHDVILLRPL